MWNRKNHKCTKLKGKIIINATLIWFEGTGKTIPLNSILEFPILSDYKMKNVIIWHWFIKNLVGTWRRNDVDATSLRRIDVSTTSCACWEFAPPPGPPNILNLPTPMSLTVFPLNISARYRLKYCLKGPLNPKQPTNHWTFKKRCQVKINDKSCCWDTVCTFRAMMTLDVSIYLLTMSALK